MLHQLPPLCETQSHIPCQTNTTGQDLLRLKICATLHSSSFDEQFSSLLLLVSMNEAKAIAPKNFVQVRSPC